MGLGMQLSAWPEDLVEGLVHLGLRVITFDNRDIGLSTKFDAHRPIGMVQAFWRYTLGLPVRAPYRLDDMAADAAALLDALGIARAHVVGVSMGGMIGQQLAARYPGRVLTLTSIMSTTGSRALSRPTPAAGRALLSRPPRGATLEQLIAHYAQVLRVIGSPAYPTPAAALRARLRQSFVRSWHPAGQARQMLAVMASGDRTAAVRTIRAPTLVIHGEADPLVPVRAGRDTAAKIPGARLHLIAGMGHDLPPGLIPALVSHIGAHIGAHEGAHGVRGG
jgi:proline iminopeptidase